MLNLNKSNWLTLHITGTCILNSLFIYLFGVLCRFQHCTGHITSGSFMDRGNQYIQLVKLLYCKLPTNSKPLPTSPLEVGPGTKPRSNAVFPLDANPTTLYYYKVSCKSRGVGDKNPQKRREIFGSASTPRQDVKHTGLSGSRGRPAVGSGCFLQDWSGNY